MARQRKPDLRDRSQRVYKSRPGRKQYSKKGRISPDNRILAVLDCETDPFDRVLKSEIQPFTLEIYIGPERPPAVFCNENPIMLVDEVREWLDAYKEPLLIYAHNGGKFDYKLLIRLVRGKAMCKPGRIMKFKYGIHEFRDSLCLIPTALGDIHKEAFDYAKMSRFHRKQHMEEILRYQHSDCVYLYEILRKAHARWGRKLTIGSVAKEQINKLYPEVCGMTETMDDKIRPFFRGGRVEPVRGVGVYYGNFVCYDFNSSYPKSMAAFNHPYGKNWFDYTISNNGTINANTVFIDLSCRSRGAFMAKDEQTGNLITPRDNKIRNYKVSIHEYRIAQKYNLISDITINQIIDCEKQTTFEQYIVAGYEVRMATKSLLEILPKNSPEYIEAKIEDTLIKLLLNNSYGKFAEDPRNQKEYLFVDGRNGKDPGDEWEIDTIFYATLEIPLSEDLVVYSRPPNRMTFNNVATAASITGGSRAMLLEACQFAINPIYMDTDSLICEGFHEFLMIDGTRIDFPFSREPTVLGALKREWSAQEVGIAGKKLYYARTNKGEMIKCKGANVDDLSIVQMRALIEEGASVINTSRGPCITMGGKQAYIVRSLRATGRTQEAVTADLLSWGT